MIVKVTKDCKSYNINHCHEFTRDVLDINGNKQTMAGILHEMAAKLMKPLKWTNHTKII